MNLLDLLLLAMMIIGFVIGYRIGLVKQISFGAGIGIGLLQAIVSHTRVSAWIYDNTGWDNIICTLLAFILILAAVVAIIHIGGMLIAGVLDFLRLRAVDRTVGAVFSTYIAVLLLAAIVHISDRFSPDNNVLGKTSQSESLLYEKVVGTSFKVIEEAKKEMTVDEEAEDEEK